jgi:hypothetical protein
VTTTRPRRLAAAVALTRSLTAPLAACSSYGDTPGPGTSASTATATPAAVTGAQLAKRMGEAAIAENSAHPRATVMDARELDTVEGR